MSLTPSDAHPAGTGLGVPDPQLLDWHPPYPKKTPTNQKTRTKLKPTKNPVVLWLGLTLPLKGFEI